jgi:hypothetical protein
MEFFPVNQPLLNSVTLPKIQDAGNGVGETHTLTHTHTHTHTQTAKKCWREESTSNCGEIVERKEVVNVTWGGGELEVGLEG